MGGHKTQRKSSLSFFGIFKIKKSHRGGGNDTWDDSMKAYKVYPSDQDKAGRWADPRIDNKASVYIDTITNKWNHVEVSGAQNVSSERPLRQFVTGKDKSTGRNSKGRITIFHIGGGAKQSQRTIDLKCNTSSVGVVERIEYDPNYTSRIAMVRWVKGVAVDRPKKVNSLQKKLHPTPKILPSISIKGQFSFSSIPGMLEDKKVESLRPKIDHVAVGLSKGSRTLSSQSQSQTGTHMRNVKDVFLFAFSSSNGKKRHDAPSSFVKVLGVPRMAVAGE
ncbi:unnamed protein product [Lactuca saligna]|uniref:Large ribosomal subunit protein uL2 RNA-binding domain-containing protein n=1 Tax=Lactuca saligna TaxID=75948 RepID=A0AA35ZJZ1_LACSI|nr:unnamed protein product [Lactuca saligna]